MSDHNEHVQQPLDFMPTDTQTEAHQEAESTAIQPPEQSEEESVVAEPEVETRKGIRRRPPFELVSDPEERKRIEFEASIYSDVLEQSEVLKRDEHKGIRLRIPDRVRRAAEEHLNRSGNGIRKRANEIANYLDAFDDASIIDACVPYPPGPEKGQRHLTEKQKIVIRGMVCCTEQHTLDSRGRIYYVRKTYNFKTLSELINDPKFGQPVHRLTLYRYIQDITYEDPLVMTYAEQIDPKTGRRFISTNYGYKIWIDFEAPNECWQSDARVLPILVWLDGKLCTVTLIIIIDGYSQVILDWCLVARAAKDEDGEWRKTDFTADHVREMLAAAMDPEYGSGCMPYYLYVDNGSQYNAVKGPIAYLSSDPLVQEQQTGIVKRTIEVRNTQVGVPPGRGLVEGKLGLTDAYFEDFPGFFAEDTLVLRNIAEEDAAVAFEHLREHCIDLFHRWDNAPHPHFSEAQGSPSRREVYQNTPTQALPAPSRLRLAYFACTVQHGRASVHKNGIRWKNTWYRPIGEEKHVWDAMATAARRRELVQERKKRQRSQKAADLQNDATIPIIKAHLRGQEQVLVSFDGETLVPVERKTGTPFRNSSHPSREAEQIPRVVARADDRVEAMYQALENIFGTRTIGVQAGSKEPVPLSAEDLERVEQPPKAKGGRPKGSKTRNKGGANKNSAGTSTSQPSTHGKPDGRSTTGSPATHQNTTPSATSEEQLRRLRESIYNPDEDETL